MNKLVMLTGAVALSLSTLLVQAQAPALKTPAPSSSQTIKQAFALGDLTVDYSRPSVKGRTVFGDLVPYGKVWRTGANGTTKLTFAEDVKVEGKDVKAGTYGLYTIPNKDSWEVMLYSDLTLNGNVASYKAENEVLRVVVKPTALTTKVETFTINLADVTSTSLVLEILWDKIRVPVKITAEIDAKIMKNIETTMAADSRPYFQAANYYYENKKDLNQALVWVNKAVEQNPKAFWVLMLKSRIEYELKDNANAAATAEKVVALAKEASNEDYTKMGEKMIADTKGKK
ncbi:MAG: hypothetical protein JWM14_538 [Chitinophagaceae bacterium]|nr:hypothetical protein [Chitinophagaceae bacterium]